MSTSQAPPQPESSRQRPKRAPAEAFFSSPSAAQPPLFDTRSFYLTPKFQASARGTAIATLIKRHGGVIETEPTDNSHIIVELPSHYPLRLTILVPATLSNEDKLSLPALVSEHGNFSPPRLGKCAGVIRWEWVRKCVQEEKIIHWFGGWEVLGTRDPRLVTPIPDQIPDPSSGAPAPPMSPPPPPPESPSSSSNPTGAADLPTLTRSNGVIPANPPPPSSLSDPHPSAPQFPGHANPDFPSAHTDPIKAYQPRIRPTLSTSVLPSSNYSDHPISASTSAYQPRVRSQTREYEPPPTSSSSVAPRSDYPSHPTHFEPTRAIPTGPRSSRLAGSSTETGAHRSSREWGPGWGMEGQGDSEGRQHRRGDGWINAADGMEQRGGERARWESASQDRARGEWQTDGWNDREDGRNDRREARSWRSGPSHRRRRSRDHSAGSEGASSSHTNSQYPPRQDSYLHHPRPKSRDKAELDALLKSKALEGTKGMHSAQAPKQISRDEQSVEWLVNEPLGWGRDVKVMWGFVHLRELRPDVNWRSFYSSHRREIESRLPTDHPLRNASLGGHIGGSWRSFERKAFDDEGAQPPDEYWDRRSSAQGSRQVRGGTEGDGREMNRDAAGQGGLGSEGPRWFEAEGGDRSGQISDPQRRTGDARYTAVAGRSSLTPYAPPVISQADLPSRHNGTTAPSPSFLPRKLAKRARKVAPPPPAPGLVFSDDEDGTPSLHPAPAPHTSIDPEDVDKTLATRSTHPSQLDTPPPSGLVFSDEEADPAPLHPTCPSIPATNGLVFSDSESDMELDHASDQAPPAQSTGNGTSNTSEGSRHRIDVSGSVTSPALGQSNGHPLSINHSVDSVEMAMTESGVAVPAVPGGERESGRRQAVFQVTPWLRLALHVASGGDHKAIERMIETNGGRLVTPQEASIIVLPIPVGRPATSLSHQKLVKLCSGTDHRSALSYQWIEASIAAGTMVDAGGYEISLARLGDDEDQLSEAESELVTPVKSERDEGERSALGHDEALPQGVLEKRGRAGVLRAQSRADSETSRQSRQSTTFSDTSTHHTLNLEAAEYEAALDIAQADGAAVTWEDYLGRQLRRWDRGGNLRSYIASLRSADLDWIPIFCRMRSVLEEHFTWLSEMEDVGGETGGTRSRVDDGEQGVRKRRGTAGVSGGRKKKARA